MSLRPLTPQSPARIAWEQAVVRAIEARACMTTSDVQAMLEADPDGVDRVFADGHDPQVSASIFLGIDPERDGLDILNAEGFKLLEVESDSIEPVAGVAESFLYCIRRQKDGSRWPVGTKLYADADVQVLRQRVDGQAVRLELAYKRAREMEQAHDNLNAENRNLRTELDDVKRRNVHALASLGEAREQRDALRSLAVELLAALAFTRSWFKSLNPHEGPQAHEVISTADATIAKAKEHGL